MTSARAKAAIKTMAPYSKEINVRLDKAKLCDGKALDHRLAAAIKLAEAKQQCKTLSLSFDEWATENVDQGIDEIRKLVTVGNSDNPRQALEDLRSTSNARVRKSRKPKINALRSAQKPEEETETPALPKPTPYQAAETALVGLPDRERLAIVEQCAHKAGMTVRPSKDARELLSRMNKAEETVEGIGTLEGVKKAYLTLGSESQKAFLAWAVQRDADTLAVTDPGEIPDILKRTASGKK